MTAEIIACPNCGNRKFDGVALDTPTVRCPACRVHFVTDLGRRLAKRDESDTRRLANLNRQLTEGIAHDNVEAILSRAEEVLGINPDDYAARYYFAYAKRRRAEAGYMKEFYAANISPDATEEQMRGILNHIIQHSEFGDWREVEEYIGRTGLADAAALLSLYKRTYDERLQRESDYLDCERDVFVCHSSKNGTEVERILAMLADAGRSAWVSSRNLRPNDSENYWKAIGRAIRSCRLLLLVYSDAASRSTDVMKELEIAYREKKRIVEINLDGTPHRENSIFDRVLDGNAWVDASAGLKQGVAALADRLFETLLNLPTAELSEDELPEPTTALAEYEATYENGRLLLEKGLYMGFGEEYLKAAYRLFYVAARETDDARAWFGVGLCHYYGYGVEKNEDKGNHLFGEYYSPICTLAEGGNAEAAYILYEYLDQGLDLYEDKVEALKWLRKAVELGSLRAAYFLSCHSAIPDVIDLLRRAYEGHFHLATYAWANCLFRGYHLMDDGGRRLDGANRNGAVRVYHDGVGEGDPRCRRRLEETHLHKKGFEIFEGTLLSLTDQWQTSVRDGVLTIPSAVSTVAPNALAKAAEVKAVQFPDAVTSLPGDAFGSGKVPALRGAGLASNVSSKLRKAKREAEAEDKRQERERDAEWRREQRARDLEKLAKRATVPAWWLLPIGILLVALCILAGIFGFFRLPDVFMCLWYGIGALLAFTLLVENGRNVYESEKFRFRDVCSHLSEEAVALCRRAILFLPLFLLSVIGFCFGGVINSRWSLLPAIAIVCLAVTALFVYYSGRSRLAFVFPTSALILLFLVPIYGGATGLLPVFGGLNGDFGEGAFTAMFILFFIIPFGVAGGFHTAKHHDCLRAAVASLCFLGFGFAFCFAAALAPWINWLVFLVSAAAEIWATVTVDAYA